MPADAWTDARIAAAELNKAAGDVLAAGLLLVLSRAAKARGDGEVRPCPDFALGFIRLRQDMGHLEPAEAEKEIDAWAASRPVALDRSAKTINRLAALAS